MVLDDVVIALLVTVLAVATTAALWIGLLAVLGAYCHHPYLLHPIHHSGPMWFNQAETRPARGPGGPGSVLPTGSGRRSADAPIPPGG